ncbi:MAG: ribosome silencing factor [Myxococcaceae bacterium]|nr:ribosome silencing factor [Myxococcaceae bacterium]MCI0670864.1 ribosome silencing factor [Myxococcaceae bacterium]
MAAKKKTTRAAAKKTATRRPAARSPRATTAKKATPARARKPVGAPRKHPAVKVKKPAARKVAPEVGAPAENPEALALARRAADLVVDKKGTDVVILDVRGRTSYADYLVLASGESERHVAALAESVEVELKKENQRALSTEGHTPGQWILMDYGDVVVHLFAQEARAFYDLEGVWPDVPREQVQVSA